MRKISGVLSPKQEKGKLAKSDLICHSCSLLRGPRNNAFYGEKEKEVIADA